MKKLLAGLMIGALAASFTLDAEAQRRLGGGRSFGKQSPTVQQRQATPPAQSPQQGTQAAPAQQPAAAAARPGAGPGGGRGGWLLRGGGLRSLLRRLCGRCGLTLLHRRRLLAQIAGTAKTALRLGVEREACSQCTDHQTGEQLLH